jgi:hypothetical protein
MEARTEPELPQGSLARAGLRWSSAGIAAGLVLLLVSGLVPERLLIVCAGLGLALALLSAAVLASGAPDARLRWKGASPALAVVLGVIMGALPGLLSGTWRRGEDPPVARSVEARSGPTGGVHTTAMMPVGRQRNAAANPGLAPPSAGKPLAGDLSEISDLLDRKARPTLEGLHRLLISLADVPESTDSVSLRLQLESSVSNLAEVAASLERIQSENSDLSPELRQVIGGGRALSSLNSSLQQLSLSQGDVSGYGAPRLRRLANATEAASRWVDRVDQQLAVRK